MPGGFDDPASKKEYLNMTANPWKKSNKKLKIKGAILVKMKIREESEKKRKKRRESFSSAKENVKQPKVEKSENGHCFCSKGKENQITNCKKVKDKFHLSR